MSESRRPRVWSPDATDIAIVKELANRCGDGSCVVRQPELADQLDISLWIVARRIRRLETLGYLRREQAPSDRRRRLYTVVKVPTLDDRHEIETNQQTDDAFTARRFNSWDPRKTPDVVARYKAGAGILTVAQEVGSIYSTVRNVLIDNGVKLRPRGGRRR
jgi:DNA-binding Lrp family transcriptional regulator